MRFHGYLIQMYTNMYLKLRKMKALEKEGESKYSFAINKKKIQKKWGNRDFSYI